MERLPPELVVYVFQFLSPPDTPVVTLVCSLWKNLWQDQLLWKTFHLRDLGQVIKPPFASDQWRESYSCIIATIDRQKNWNFSSRRMFLAASMDADVWVANELRTYPLPEGLIRAAFSHGKLSLFFFFTAISLVSSLHSPPSIPLSSLLLLLAFLS